MHNSSQTGKLFDRKFVANALRNTRCCPKCRSEYSYNYDLRMGDTHVKSNRPFLLTCGHNMCENCVYQNRQNLTCGVCQRPIDVPVNQRQFQNFHVRDFFDMNFFLLGELHHMRFYRRDSSVNNTMLANSQNYNSPTSPKSPAEAIAVLKCSECELEPALGLCRQCNVYYCKACYDSIHMYGKALKRHTLLSTRGNHGSAHLGMPRPSQCRRHHRLKDRYCRKCDLICCVLCAKADHNNHGWLSLLDENGRIKEEIATVLESVKISRENLRRAQKDVKAIEMQLEEYAAQCLKDITDYFLQLHSFLQNEERRIISDFNSKCLLPQIKIRETSNKLVESQTTLNRIRSELEFYQHRLPADIHLRHAISVYNTQLEHLQCQVQISKLTKNPFIFKTQHDIRNEFEKYYHYEYVDPNISLRIGPMYGDLNRTFHGTDSQSSMDLDVTAKSSSCGTTGNHKQRINEKNQRKKQALCQFKGISVSNSTSSIDVVQKLSDNGLARITHVRTPEHFYIQMEKSLRNIRELSNKYVNFTLQDLVPKTISEGSCYMAYHQEDKQWYRAMVKKILPKDTYKVFLVDIGIKLELPKNRLYELDSKSLSIPFAAIRCAIYDIMPTGKTWNEEANNLLIEITRNQLVRVSIIEQIKDNILKVDLFTTHSSEPISVRDSFLYTGLARERSGVAKFQSQTQKLSPVARINQRLQKHNLQSGDMLMVKVSYIENPQLFYVIKMDQVEVKLKMRNDLNLMYEHQESQLKPVFLATLQMCCAVRIEDMWHRGCVEDIRTGGKICVRLVDEGIQKVVDWRQIYTLASTFQTQKEFAIKCALADIEPLQENNYAWSKDATKEFRQLASNPILQMAVLSAKQNDYKITLHVCKKHLDINIGAVLAKYGHCLSTGDASQNVEVFKTPKRHLNIHAAPSNSAVQNYSSESCERDIEDNAQGKDRDKNGNSTVKVLKRTPIKVVHIVDPGEFYIQIANLLPGIAKFHNQLQEAQKQVHIRAPMCSVNSHEQREWFVGDHCLVYTKFKSSMTPTPTPKEIALTTEHSLDQCEWYRCIIISHAPEHNSERPYTVFLRDFGNTVSGISRFQLSSIDQQWDRVTNAVHRCHLACVEPTGGMTTWSHSAVDCFKHTVSSFETLSATLQGKRAPGSNSLPIVLWGTITETTDPLAPCLSKHSNINRVLVKAGLAHSVQRLDITEQLDKLVQLELAEGEITLEKWYKNFEENTTLKDIERNLKNPLTNDHHDVSLQFETVDHCNIPHSPRGGVDDLLLNEANDMLTIYDGPAPTAWLESKKIEKSIFAGLPTYVDFDCIIYLHDAGDDELLKRILLKISKTYGHEQTPNEAQIEFKPGQACIVRYHVDKKFYRGVVQKRNAEGHYIVQFIDYGNVEAVERSNVRPFAPFPKLPCIACKYRIEGIRPKDGGKTYPTSVLDFIHGTIVDKLVSVRVPTSELPKEIKMCSIRIGTSDLAELLISEGYADRELSLPVKSVLTSYNRLKPVVEFTENLHANFEHVNVMNITKEFQFRNSGKKSGYGENVSCSEENNSESDDDAVNECLDQLLTNIDKEEINLDSDSSNEPDVSHIEEQHQQTFVPPRKKRMFDSHEYKQLHAQMQYENLYGSENFMQNEEEDMVCEGASAGGNILGCAFGIADDDDDDDIVELEQSFARNYWHAIDDAAEEKNDNLAQMKHSNSVPQRQDLESSGFDKFFPNETSSVFSHFSGIETFKQPQLPDGIRNFNCSVISVVTPTVLQILPHLTEFEYRDVELQRRIKHLVKSAPPLKLFDPRTVCLSCYNKDKKWYRALIRSYNPTAKQADVFYVDYLNSESVPIKHLKQCPMELINWPLRTFKVRLHGLSPNPRMREKDLRQALQNILLKRTFVARIKKEPVKTIVNIMSMLDTIGNGGDAADAPLMEVSLYESNESAFTAYESLIQDNFYNRI